MTTKIEEMKWKLHKTKEKKLLLWGLKTRHAALYPKALIQKLRTIYDGGIPASILLLSNGMSNGHCYDRAFLMAKAFLDEDYDVKLIYAGIDSIRLNPKYLDQKDDPLYADHCFVQVTTKDKETFIIDTSTGIMYDKHLYWLIERPKVRKVNDKKVIQEMEKIDSFYHPEDIERDKYAMPLILPNIERTYGRPLETYSKMGIEYLQREISLFKKKINYDAICQEIEEDMKRLGF